MFFKYVLEGGPGSGKTRGIEYLRNTLGQKGYKTFSIQETATELIQSGLDRTDKDFPYYNFSLMLYKELLYEKNAYMENGDMIILCDRGRMDPKAYRGEEVFNRILAQANGMTEEQVLNSYDGVLFLQTTAEGLPNEYIQDDIRIESCEEAKSIDEKLRKVWSAHHNFIYIPNEIEFNDKLKNIEVTILNDIEKRRKSKISAKELIDFADKLSISNKEMLDILREALGKISDKLIAPAKENDPFQR